MPDKDGHEQTLQEVTIETIAAGALPELFQREFRSALANIADPNTDPEATRKVTIEVTLKPDKNREAIITAVQCRSKVSSVMPSVSVIFTAQEGKEFKAYCREVKQPELFEGGKDGKLALVTDKKKA
jgi:hypothetical protein